jgi:hypothetical protein
MAKLENSLTETKGASYFFSIITAKRVNALHEGLLYKRSLSQSAKTCCKMGTVTLSKLCQTD